MDPRIRMAGLGVAALIVGGLLFGRSIYSRAAFGVGADDYVAYGLSGGP